MKSILESQKQNYLTWIGIEQDKVAKCERNYESLFRFKSVVLNSREEFNEISINQLGVLSSLEEVKEKNNAAQGYYDIVKKIIVRKKLELIEPNYEALFAKISTKLSGYLNSINYCESLVELYQEKIREIEEQIEFLESIEGRGVDEK